jgi:hypothetical protein
MGHAGATGTAVVAYVDPVLRRIGEVEGFNGGSVGDLGGLKGESGIRGREGENF